MKESALKRVLELLAKDDYFSAYLECTYVLMLLPKDNETTTLCKFIIARIDDAYSDVVPVTSNDFLARGLAHLNFEELDEAMEDLNKAIELDPNNHYAYKLKVHYHVTNLRPDLAIKEMLLATNVIAKGEYFDDLANLYYETGDIKNALKCHLKAIELAPENPRLWYNLGVYYADTNDVKAAAIMFNQAIKLWPEYEDAIINLKHLKTNYQHLL